MNENKDKQINALINLAIRFSIPKIVKAFKCIMTVLAIQCSLLAIERSIMQRPHEGTCLVKKFVDYLEKKNNISNKGKNANKNSLFVSKILGVTIFNFIFSYYQIYKVLKLPKL